MSLKICCILGSFNLHKGHKNKSSDKWDEFEDNKDIKEIIIFKLVYFYCF